MKNSLSLSIQRVGLSQAETLLELAESTFRAGFAHLNDPEHFEAYMSQAFNLRKIQEELSTAGSEFYFCMAADDIAGYIKLNSGAAQSDIKTEPGIELERIYVKPEMQGQKIGEYMLQQAISLARQGGFPYLWLGVWEKNEAAIRFYLRHGFEQFSSHTFMLGGDPQTDLLMKLPLVQTDS